MPVIHTDNNEKLIAGHCQLNVAHCLTLFDMGFFVDPSVMGHESAHRNFVVIVLMIMKLVGMHCIYDP